MRKQNILFDLGNVVLDWDTEKLVNSLDLTESKKKVIEKELFNNHYWTELDQGVITEKEVIQNIAAKGELTVTELQYCFEEARKSLTEIPATIKLMEELYTSGVNMYCLSNMAIETYRFIENRKFFEYFKGVVISGFIKIIKPDSEIFRHTLDKFNLAPESVTFIDDSYVNIQTAQKFGINCVHFKRTSDCYKQIRENITLQKFDILNTKD